MLEFPQEQVTLSGMTELEELAAEYKVQGLSIRLHPMQVLRSRISRDGILKSSEVITLFPGTRVRVAGCVVCRQAPVTARGHVFLTLEDEDGLLNVVVKPKVYENYRYVVRVEPLIVVEGVLQKRNGTVNIVAEQLIPLRRESERQLINCAPPARSFA